MLGISLRTQEIYLLLFVCRYVDVFTNFISMYNTIMKFLFIGTTAYIVFLMRNSLKNSLSPEPEGTQLCYMLIPGCMFLALVTEQNSIFPPRSHSVMTLIHSPAPHLPE
jgi:ER lumen protein retaining receptor